MIKQLCTSLLLLVASTSGMASSYPISDLPAGPHKVGFKAFHEYDHRRTFRPVYNEDGEIIRDHQARPMQIALWYPAKKSGKPMHYRDYWYLNVTRDNFRTLTPALKKQREQQYINMWGMLGELDTTQMEANLSLPMAASLNAQQKAGEYPLILLAQRENRGAFINFQLAEYLASHGYMVAITPAKSKTDNTPETDFWSQDGIQSGLADLQFVKGFMMQYPGVDKNRIGAIGYGFGATSALALAQDDFTIRAVVSLAGIVGIENDFIKPTLDTMNYFNKPDRIQTPLLHINVNNMYGQEKRPFPLYDQIRFADVHLVTLHEVDEIALGATFLIDWLRSLKKENKYDYTPEQAEKAYRIALESILAFVDHYVAADANTDLVSQLTNVNQSPISDYQFKGGLTPPPSERFLFSLFREDPEKAEALFNKFHQLAPETPFLNARTLGNLAQSLQGQALYKRALIINRIAAKAYPDRAWAVVGMATALAGLERYNEAKQTLDKTQAMDVPDWLRAQIDTVKATLTPHLDN